MWSLLFVCQDQFIYKTLKMHVTEINTRQEPNERKNWLWWVNISVLIWSRLETVQHYMVYITFTSILPSSKTFTIRGFFPFNNSTYVEYSLHKVTKAKTLGRKSDSVFVAFLWWVFTKKQTDSSHRNDDAASDSVTRLTQRCKKKTAK